MFCPKCGMQNPETGKFCRGCGTDLGTVSDALSGKLSGKSQGFGMIEPIQPMSFVNHKGKRISRESASATFFMGLAFLVVSIVLGITGKGSGWWFWMLIPAFAMLGTGIAQFGQLKQAEKQNTPVSPKETQNLFEPNPATTANAASLPPTQTEYVSPVADSRYKTGDLVPPSVTDSTTRHLEINKEGETMTLPKK